MINHRQSQVTDYYDTIANDYDESRFSNSYGQFLHQQEMAFLSAILRKHNTENVLSVGCGTGRLMEWADIGLDISSEMLAIAKSKFPDKQFIHADASSTGLASAEITLSFCLHVLMHLSEAQAKAIFQEMHRISTPNAIMVFDVPSVKRRKLLRRQISNWHGATSYDISSIRILLKNDWEIINFQGIMMLPIHRFPKRWRSTLLRFDTFLCKSFLALYASYIIVTIQRK